MMVDEKAQWFNLFESIYAKTDCLDSGVDCIHRCDGRCCPQKTINGHTGFIIFLPFELEYIANKLGVNTSTLQQNWFANQVSVQSRTKNQIPVAWTKHCPFLDSGKCNLYANRPFDCRVFPVIRRLDGNGQLKTMAATKCPEHNNLSTIFQQVIEELWASIDLILPPDWLVLRDTLIVSDTSFFHEKKD